MEWARNINKAEVTQGDESYASYTSYGQSDDMYFFINSGENPQKLGKDRIIFKQGYSRNPNMFVIKIDEKGEVTHKKLIDDKEVRLPIMVSRPLVDSSEDQLIFYAKRGSKKQLIRVAVGVESSTPAK
jgi:transcriptional regulator of nitric oxide reductase